jgi:hypothetical protein
VVHPAKSRPNATEKVRSSIFAGLPAVIFQTPFSPGSRVFATLRVVGGVRVTVPPLEDVAVSLKSGSWYPMLFCT